ncbi:sialate O-acetylesterase [uncultured Fibrella sp.]|uniref:sialate O-acetylesterase n=1 Tax=uncultured Fibrella sp. TaxID=1284596 RepID=UPI0035C97357
MKYSYAFLLVMSSWLSAWGQSGVVFQTLPRNFQLFPRNPSNQAVVLVEGTVTDASVRRLTMQLDRAGTINQSQQVNLTASRTFRFDPIIRAELAEYTLRIYLHRLPGDSTLVAERKRLVCGDVFLIYGQSNAIGGAGLDKIAVNDQFLRQCGYVYGADIVASMQWTPALQPYAAVGAFGLYLGEAIQKRAQIPIGLLTGAEGGANIGQLADRNTNNPADLTTFYGRLLYRTQWAGVQNQIKAIIYKQGEAEAGSSTANYPANFERLYRMLRQDYGPNPRLYVSQINVLSDGSPDAGALRDFQRRLPEIYPEGVSNIATVGTAEYDGLHYGLGGSRQIGYEQADQILRDLYASGASEQVNSPNVRQVFQNSRNDTLTIVFEPAMQMRWSVDSLLTKNGQTYTRRLIDLFLADGQKGQFTGGSAEANRVYLALRQPGIVQALSYFPSFYGEAPRGFYDGPTLRNQLGIRAFTFDRYPVARALPSTTNLVVTRTTRQEISLSWTAGTTEATAVLVERSDGNRSSFSQIARLAGTATTYTDMPTGSGVGPYAYRVRLASQRAESGASNVAEGRLLPPCALSAIVTGDKVVSYGGTLTLSVGVFGTETGNPVTYLWNGPGGLVTASRDLIQYGLTPGLSGLYSVTVTQGICSVSTSVSITIQAPLATEPINSEPALWPNPVRTGQSVQVNVPDARLNETIEVIVADAFGRVILQQAHRKQGVSPLPIALPTLSAGIYIIELKPAFAASQTYRLRVE